MPACVNIVVLHVTAVLLAVSTSTEIGEAPTEKTQDPLVASEGWSSVPNRVKFDAALSWTWEGDADVSTGHEEAEVRVAEQLEPVVWQPMLGVAKSLHHWQAGLPLTHLSQGADVQSYTSKIKVLVTAAGEPMVRL